MLEILFLV